MKDFIFAFKKGTEHTIECADTSSACMTFQQLIQDLARSHVAWRQVCIENIGDRHNVTYSIAENDADNTCAVNLLF